MTRVRAPAFAACAACRYRHAATLFLPYGASSLIFAFCTSLLHPTSSLSLLNAFAGCYHALLGFGVSSTAMGRGWDGMGDGVSCLLPEHISLLLLLHTAFLRLLLLLRTFYACHLFSHTPIACSEEEERDTCLLYYFCLPSFPAFHFAALYYLHLPTGSSWEGPHR